jgi:hypothetical protein
VARNTAACTFCRAAVFFSTRRANCLPFDVTRPAFFTELFLVIFLRPSSTLLLAAKDFVM